MDFLKKKKTKVPVEISCATFSVCLFQRSSSIFELHSVISGDPVEYRERGASSTQLRSFHGTNVHRAEPFTGPATKVLYSAVCKIQHTGSKGIPRSSLSTIFLQLVQAQYSTVQRDRQRESVNGRGRASGRE